MTPGEPGRAAKSKAEANRTSERDTQPATTSLPPLRRPTMELLVVAAISGVLVAAVAFAVGGRWLPALGVGAVLALGIYLWASGESRSWGDIGQGILTSVVVAVALLAVQRGADERARDVEVRREAEQRRLEDRRQRATDRQSLQLTLGLQSDLSRVDFRRRDLRGFILLGKKLRQANLGGAQLQKATLAEADLRDATADGARFDDANLTEADLRGMSALRARFDRADLSFSDLRDAFLVSVPPPDRGEVEGAASFRGAGLLRANLRGVSLVRVDFRSAELLEADLRSTNLEQADLRKADLREARLCGARLDGARLRGALYSKGTRWPRGFKPKAAGARLSGLGSGTARDPFLGSAGNPPCTRSDDRALAFPFG
jgi:uncharacterized protein YjbI with pentapeptide repeats